MRRSEILILFIVCLSFAAGIYFYPLAPERMASHWNTQGEVDGYIGKFWGVFLMPLISVGMLLLFIFIPKIDPLKENIEKFRKYFDVFVVVIMFFLFYLYLLTLFWSMGTRFNMIKFLVPAFAVVFYTAGILVENAKKNWSIGIRTPWTLSSEAVWDKTHKIGGKLFKYSSAIALLGFIFPERAIYFVVLPVVFSALFSFIYSYFEYKKRAKGGGTAILS